MSTGVIRDGRQDAEAFEKYLSTRKVLIADPGATSRTGLANIFRDLGAKRESTILVNTFAQAESSIESEKPQIVVAEYDIGKRCGLELLQRQRAQRPEESKQTLFVIVTGNTSQTAVARSAEEDIDAYVIKPLTPEVVRKTIMRAAMEKITPRRYNTLIDEGKVLLAAKDLDGAEAKFTEATGLDPAPSLALAYIGQVKVLKDALAEAKVKYAEGLDFNRIHYKCLVGLYDTLMKEQLHEEAYDVVKRLSQYFPANPKRLSEVLRLAIVTGKFEDIEKYYAVFINLDERDSTLISYVCAALVVCGKHYLNSNAGRTRAMELFQKASVTARGRKKFLREIILALLDSRLVKEAEGFLKRFPPEECDSDEFLLMRFLVAAGAGHREMIVDQGRALVQRGLKEIRLYTTLLKVYVETKNSTAIDQIYSDAVRLFPDRKAEFDAIRGTPAS